MTVLERIKVWDGFVRVFHWSLVTGFVANALILDDESVAHIYVGYAVMGLVALRLVWGFVGSPYARFSSFPPDMQAALGQARDMLAGRRTVHVGHTPLGAWMIYALLLTLCVIGTSGYLMTTDMFWGLEWPEEVHETAVAVAEALVLVHVGAVVFESRRTGVNLPRAMVTGYKEIPRGETDSPPA